MNERPTVAEVVGKLEACGSSAQIADFLAEQGIKGTPNCTRTCAIAQYVAEQCGAAAVRVTAKAVEAWGYDDGATFAPIPGDSPILDFIVDFDDREYPELIAGEVMA